MMKALLVILFGIGLILGGYLLFLYQEFQTMIKPEIPKALCQKGTTYYQIDRDSTVYLKSKDECLDEREVSWRKEI